MGIFTKSKSSKKIAADTEAIRPEPKTDALGYEQFDLDTAFEQFHPANKNKVYDVLGAAPDSGSGKKYLAEFLGVFFLTLVASTEDASGSIGLPTVFMLAALTYGAANISCAHFNPAVTVAHYFRGTISTKDAFFYAFWQVMGATVGVMVLGLFFDIEPNLKIGKMSLDTELMSLDIEYTDLYYPLRPTFLLCLVHVAVLSGGSRTQFYGLAIGFSLFAGVVAFGERNFLFNPAFSFGNWLADGLLGDDFEGLGPQLGVVGWQLVSGALAAFLFNYMNGAKEHFLDCLGPTGPRLVTEFIGTFLFVSILSLSNDSSQARLAQAVGFAYAALVYVGAEISEAHFNPTVTFAHIWAGESKISDALGAAEHIGYFVAQILGATLSAFCAYFFNDITVGLPEDILDPKYIVGLTMGGFLLSFVHLNVLGAQEGNGFFGLAVGFSVIAAIVVFSNPANPAAAIGLYVINGLFGDGFGAPADLAVLVLVPFAGATLAGALAILVQKGDAYSKYWIEAVGIGIIVICILSTAKQVMTAKEAAAAAAAVKATAEAAAARYARTKSFWGRSLSYFDDESGADGSPAAIGLDQGLLVAAITYAGAYVSNAHFNPAITVAHMINGDSANGFSVEVGLKYLLTHVLSATFFACVGGYLYGIPDAALLFVSKTHTLSFLLGCLFMTFTLTLVHLTTLASQRGNGFFGLAIGFVIFTGALALGDSETALFNPATVIGLYVANVVLGSGYGGTDELLGAFVFLVVLFVGAALGALVFKLLEGKLLDVKVFEVKIGAVVAEVLGTFLIVATILKAPSTPAGSGDAVAIGLMYVSVTYALGHISGAHFNGAITMLYWVKGSLQDLQALVYVVAQTVGALLAALAIGVDTPIEAAEVPLVALTTEALFAFLLCVVHAQVFNVVLPARNGYYGLAMGFTFYGGYAIFFSLTGGLFNPTTALAFYLFNAASTLSLPALGTLIPFVAGPCLAAFLASLEASTSLLSA
jgi:aquaporin Z